ncbi:hypothetical protein [Lutimonas vermicola]|uniref:Acetyltransferase n=1 Tax=Lutimonas vermicola TaxID=414288 RepID=A0ABU9L413_9FLAO
MSYQFKKLGKNVRFDIYSKFSYKQISIEDDVWKGTNIVNLKGITIAEGSISAAGSLVAKSTYFYPIYKGVPAKFYKFRWTENEIKEHEQILKKY